MDDKNIVIDVSDVTVRFNRASQQVNNLKEYVIKMVKKELMFQEFLALQNVSLQVRKGEAWGIVGTNGSGKSTLLKLICGILKPYKGSVSLSGTIAPLIELGAGFDGELTARENVLLNLPKNRSKPKNRKSLILLNYGIFWICRSRITLPVWRQDLDLLWQRWFSRIS